MKHNTLAVAATVIAAALLAGVVSPAHGASITSMITYQGFLEDSGVPVSGQYDFQFALYDMPTGGTQQGTTQTITNQTVTDGMCTMMIGFDPGLFDGNDMWLEVRVRPAGTGTYTALKDRQPMTSVATSLWALNSEYLGGHNSSYFVSTSADYGRSGVASNLYEGTSTLTSKYVNATGPETVQGTSSSNMLLVRNSGSGAALRGEANGGGYGGWFTSSNDHYDLVLGGAVGRINTDPGDGDSMLILSSNDDVEVRLDNDAGEEAEFRVVNSGGTHLLNIDEDGDAYISNTLSVGTTGLPGVLNAKGNYSTTNTIEDVVEVVRGTTGTPAAGEGAGLIFRNEVSNGGNLLSGRIACVMEGTNVTSASAGLLFQTLPTGASPSDALYLDPNGYAGIGTRDPESPLHIDAGNAYYGMKIENAGSYGLRSEWDGSSAGAAILAVNNGTGGDCIQALAYGSGRSAIRAVGSSGVEYALNASASGADWAGYFEGNVKIDGDLSIYNGTTLVLELGYGLDYAEGFDVSDADHDDTIAAGTVLVIDSDNPGQLTMSTQAYDTRVAGIVAGAKGLGSGVRLGAGQFDHDVALAGRVYCNVEAGNGDIQPGDLLTTSSMPGYAMKATDTARRQGAILGKAMEPMKKGQTGQILVLVSLQ